MKRQNDQSLKEVLKELVEVYRLKAKLNQTRVRSLWAEKMGTTINQYTTDIKIVRKTLYLTLSSAPLRQELSFSKDKIKDMVNGALGEDYVEEVVIK